MPHLPLDQLTNRQLHLYLIDLLETQAYHNQRLDQFMSNLSASVESLQAAVDTIAVRFASQVGPLSEALAAAQQALADMTVDDESQKAALAAALADADSAVTSINSDVNELNAIGAAPDVPVEPVPVDEMPAPPSEDTSTPSEA